jgi:hypothetical protein
MVTYNNNKFIGIMLKKNILKSYKYLEKNM